jgi:hypothetical protein
VACLLRSIHHKVFIGHDLLEWIENIVSQVVFGIKYRIRQFEMYDNKNLKLEYCNIQTSTSQKC